MSIEKIKQRLFSLAITESKWLEQAKWRAENEAWLDVSSAIAIKILRWLRANGMTQKELAERLDYSPQYISKILKGSENLTLETITKIEKVLGIKLIEVPGLEFARSEVGETPIIEAAVEFPLALAQENASPKYGTTPPEQAPSSEEDAQSSNFQNLSRPGGVN